MKCCKFLEHKNTEKYPKLQLDIVKLEILSGLHTYVQNLWPTSREECPTLPSEFAIARKSLERRLRIHAQILFETLLCVQNYQYKDVPMFEVMKKWKRNFSVSALPNLPYNQFTNFMEQELSFHQWTVIHLIKKFLLWNPKVHNHKSLLYNHFLMPSSPSIYFRLFKKRVLQDKHWYIKTPVFVLKNQTLRTTRVENLR
jgi:hypothetical protein